MSERNDGGAAFPTEPRGPAYGKHHDGMTLRDWFAGQALAGMKPPTVYVGAEETKQSFRRQAQDAYWLADAMLEARK